jgi:hypothetical protein
MGPRWRSSWRERIDFTTRVRHRMRSGIHRLRAGWWPILQTAVAAGVAWFLAVLILGHERPEFAPIAAVISLGLAVGERSRRVLELTLVHLQDRFRVMGYRKIHENSDLCTFVLR